MNENMITRKDKRSRAKLATLVQLAFEDRETFHLRANRIIYDWLHSPGMELASSKVDSLKIAIKDYACANGKADYGFQWGVLEEAYARILIRDFGGPKDARAIIFPRPAK